MPLCPEEPRSGIGGDGPKLPRADGAGGLQLSGLTLGLTTLRSSLLAGSATKAEVSLPPFSTTLPGRQASSSLSDSEKIPEEKE